MTQHHIFFLISDQHFIPTGGIGSFFRGFLRMAGHFGWQVTVIMDRLPREDQGKDMKQAHPSARYVMPDKPTKYGGYNPDPSQYAKEVPNKIKTANFVTALQMSLNTSKPTHILINTPEAALAVIELGLQNSIPTTFYTHHENLVLPVVPKSSKFGPEYMQMLFDIVEIPNIQTATQSHYNVDRMKHLNMSKPPLVLPMPIPDPELLKPYDGPHKGVLFIGRHEPRKQPKVFAAKVAKAGLPAKILTNERAADTFADTLRDHGITDYEIRSQITGQEKADFIKSAKIAFHPAKLESYGFSAMETLAAGLPTLLVHEYGWWQAFIDAGVHITPIRQAHLKLQQLYERSVSAAPTHGIEQEQQTFAEWEQYFSSLPRLA